MRDKELKLEDVKVSYEFQKPRNLSVHESEECGNGEGSSGRFVDYEVIKRELKELRCQCVFYSDVFYSDVVRSIWSQKYHREFRIV